MFKFKKHFSNNYQKLKAFDNDMNEGPKFSSCFLDLAHLLNTGIYDEH